MRLAQKQKASLLTTLKETSEVGLKKPKDLRGFLGGFAFLDEPRPVFVDHALHFVYDVLVLWCEEVSEPALSREVVFDWPFLLRCQLDEFAGR